MKIISKATFWVTNTSSMNVTLADLAINIRAYTTINLLDEKHHSYTLDQLQKSAAAGSIFKKRNKIVVRNIPPLTAYKETLPIQKEAIIPSRERSVYNIKEENYEELQVLDEDQKKQDEEFANANAELAEMDTKK